MDRRYFWHIPECVKYRIIFENAETILGISGTGERRLFRKDTGHICFCEKEALNAFVKAFAEREFRENREVAAV